jgi:succinate dehydrogenase / fumarate reductase flavoprotein subunit
MIIDALHREESCGGHFREEHKDPQGETQRDDKNFKYAAAWMFDPNNSQNPTLVKEPLVYEETKIAERNYK